MYPGPNNPQFQISTNKFRLAVTVSALGYFVDVYDLVLFSVVRVKSLESFGLSGEQLLSEGVFLLNMQTVGLLVGGIVWGILGDKFGRVKVLFGSILLYSLANIANGLVTSIPQYAVVRFLAGFGLAGELGAGITLVCECMSAKSRGWGTTAVATVGVAGAVVAGLVADLTDWRTSYFIGGGLGLLLLAMRVGVYESGLFESIKAQSVVRGSFKQIFATRERALRYVSCILSGLPIWYVVGVLITFSPEIAKGLNLPEAPSVGRAIMYSYIGFVLGDFSSGLLSQLLKTRIRTMQLFLLLCAGSSFVYLKAQGADLKTLYTICVALGFSAGYWAVLVTTASEQFGTNLRATATTTVPNFIRGSVVIFASLFQYLTLKIGVLESAATGMTLTILFALIGLACLKESYGRELTFIEE